MVGQTETESQDFTFSDIDQWGVQDGEGGFGQDGKENSYTDWVRMIREILRTRFDTIEDFLPDAILKDEEMRDLVIRWIELGKRQLHAPCNNRRSELARLKHEVAVIDTYLVDGILPPPDEELEDDPLYELEFGSDVQEMFDYLAIIDDGTMTLDDRKAKAQGLRDDLSEQARHIYDSIQEDKRVKQFEDYAPVHRMFYKMTENSRPNIGSLTLKLPYFLARAFTACKATEQDTRRHNAQAVVARDIYYEDGRRSQRGQRRRQQRHDGLQGQYGDDYYDEG